MNKLKNLLLLLIAIAIVGISSSAASAQTICKHYSTNDPFEGGDAYAGWSPWNNSVYGSISFPTDSQGVSGIGYGKLTLSFLDSVNSFVLIDKVFDVASATSHYRTNLVQCGNAPWPPPAGNPVTCSADVYVKPTGGATGALQFIDPATYEYLFTKSFSYSVSNQWVNLSTGTVSNCRRSMLVRVVMDHTVSGAKAMLLDSLTVIWNYY
jgi:hypothetical protein